MQGVAVTFPRSLAGAALGGLTVLIATGCGGSTSTAIEAGNVPPLTTATVTVQRTGDRSIVLSSPPGTPASQAVRFHVDDAGLLVVDVTVASHAALRSDVIMTATCYDPTRAKIATATGGDVFFDPGTTRTISLTSPRPDQSISAVTINVVTHPSVATSPVP